MDAPVSISPFLSGFSFASQDEKVFLFGGTSYPDYNNVTKNLFELVPPKKKRNQVPSPLSQLIKIDLGCETLSVLEGPDEAASHNGSLTLLSRTELFMITCDPHLFVYSGVNRFGLKECDLRGEFGGCTISMSVADKTVITCITPVCGSEIHKFCDKTLSKTSDYLNYFCFLCRNINPESMKPFPKKR